MYSTTVSWPRQASAAINLNFSDKKQSTFNFAKEIISDKFANLCHYRVSGRMKNHGKCRRLPLVTTIYLKTFLDTWLTSSGQNAECP